MSTPPGFGFGMDPESLRDAPLFRELQRVMAAGGGGPVNWELARQVGVATAAEAGPDPEPTEADRRGLEEAVRVAELQVTARTGLEAPGRLAPVRAVRRSEWVTRNTSSLQGLIEPAATRTSQALERGLAEQLPPEAGPMAGLLTQVGPLLQGSQVGQVLGGLATEVFATYDVAVPRDGEDDHAFVVSNLGAFERDWSLDPTELRTAVALREVALRLAFAQPWVRPHVVGLVDDFLSTLTVDVAGMMERLSGLDPTDPGEIERALGEGDGTIFGTVLDDEQRIKLARVQAFVGAAEGYAAHVVAEVGAGLLGTWPMIAEALRRHRESEETDPVFSRLLGIPVERAVAATGRAFCDAVVEGAGEAVLASMWREAEAMPSLPELDEPTLWLSRTV